nr:hypothetical protein Iba_scaffold26467CG0470 [Ipomoea batatas]
MDFRKLLLKDSTTLEMESPGDSCDLLERSTKKWKRDERSLEGHGNVPMIDVAQETPLASLADPVQTTFLGRQSSDRPTEKDPVDDVDQCGPPATQSPESTMEQDGRANGEDTTHGGEFLNPLVKKKPSKSRLPAEKYGPWMLVTRKPKRPTRKPKAHQSANRYPKKQVCMPDRMSYQQEMPNTSCYAPLQDMEDDGIREDLPPTQGENPSGTPVHAGAQRKQHNPRMNVKEPLWNPDNSGYTRGHYIAPQNANKSRGGRGNLPRRAAAETKHTVV